MSYIPEYHENYYRVEGTAFNQGKIGIGTINPVQLLHVSGGNIRLDGTGFFNGDLNVTGNLNVYGSTAQFAVSQVIAEDKSIELNVATGNPIGGGSYTTSAFTDDAGADEGGLVLKSTQGDKVILYETVTPASGWVSNQRWNVSGNYGKNTLNLTDTTVNVGMTIGGDTNLYRSTNDTLRTDDSLIVDGSLTVNGASTSINSSTITLGDANTDSVTINAGPISLVNATAAIDALEFGSGPNLANLYRSANDTLRTDDNLTVDLDLTVNGSTTLGSDASDTVTINAGPVNLPNATSAADALVFGSGPNLANLYRSANDVLRTDDSLIVNTNLTANGNTVLGDAYADTVLITGKLLRGILTYSGAGVTTQASSTQITTDKVIVTGAGILNGALLLPTAIAGMEIEVKNRAGQAINIYASPASDRIFDSSTLIANATALALASNTNKNFVCAPSGAINVWFT